MGTLIAVSGLGIITLLIEILNLRKVLIPVVVTSLVAILGLTVAEFYLQESFFDINSFNMIVETPFAKAFSSLFILLAIFIIAISGKFY